MAKKSFKDNNPALAFMTPTILEGQVGMDTHGVQIAHDAHSTHEAQEVQEVHEAPPTQIARGTQGRKGHKLPRINMAFTEANLDYLHIISRIEGISATEYVNRLVKADSEARAEIVEAARKIYAGGK